jgi:hypothetical protein
MRIINFILGVGTYAFTRLADIGCRVLAFQGEDMAQQTKTRANNPDPATPIVSLDEIDEALVYTSLNPKRDEHWRRWTDGLLDQRNRIARSGPRRETRVVFPDEYPEG